MGTRGYYCYRFRGRLYVYYNHWDSYPEVLGRFLLENIPVDPEEYQEWLSRLRQQFAEIEEILEKQVLTLPEGPVQPRYTTRVFESGISESLSAWQFHVDERLEIFPSYFEEPSVNLMIEWVYLIDLDRELIRIKSQGPETSFKLQSFPRQLQWAQDFYHEEDEEDEEDEEGNEMPDKSPVGQPFESLIKPAPSSKALLDKYWTLKVTKVKAKTVDRPSPEVEHVYTVRELLFKQFIQVWSRRLSKHILLCQATDFIYREVVFAVLSLASGQFTLLADQSSVGRDRQSYLSARLGSPYGSNILPNFGSSVHAKNVLPGSAPDSSIFWFKGVVILLVDGQVDGDGLKAAIARLAAFGDESDHKSFDGLVINIRSFMLVRVNGPDVVQCTDMIELVIPSNSPRTAQESSDEPPTHETFLPVSVSAQGFNIMMKFFQTAESYTLKPFKPVANSLPNELYDKIISMVDPDTYVKCAEVSESFQHYVHRHIRLSSQPNLNLPQQESTDFSHHVIKGLSSVTSDLNIYDAIEARDVEGTLLPFEEGKNGPRWVPVIGNDDRASMILECAITCPALAVHAIPTAEDQQPELQDPGLAALRAIEDPWVRRLDMFGSGHFYIPEIVGVKATSRAWECYLRAVLMKSPENGQPLSWTISNVAHQYILPRSTYCIPLEPHRYKNPLRDPSGRRYHEFSGLIWLKKPVDFESKIMAQSLTDAQDFLNSTEIAESEGDRAARRGLLILAFGSKTQCFEWDFHENDHPGDVPPVIRPLEDGAVLDIGIKDERERFQELFGKFRDEAEAARVLAEAMKQDVKDDDPV